MTTNKENELKDLLAEEKEEYRKKIIEMVNKIERKDILEYLYTFIKAKLKGHI